MYVDAWNLTSPYESFVSGADLFELRECDLTDLPADAQDAVLLAGALLQAYLEEARRVAEA